MWAWVFLDEIFIYKVNLVSACSSVVMNGSWRLLGLIHYDYFVQRMYSTACFTYYELLLFPFYTEKTHKHCLRDFGKPIIMCLATWNHETASLFQSR